MQVRLGDTVRLFATVAIFLAIGTQAFTNTKAQPVPLNWQTLNLKHGWQASSGGYREPAAAIDSNNIVHLRGGAHQPGGMSNHIFTLPSAYRPAANVAVPVLVLNAEPAYLLVATNGEVSVLTANYPSAQSFTGFESITFSKDGQTPP